MTTFFAWLIANIKVPFYTIIILLFEILLFTGAIPCDEDKILTAAIMAVFSFFVIVVFFGGYPAKSILGNLLNLLVLIAAYVAAIIMKNTLGYNTVFLWTGIPVLILAIVVAVFTASHMEEVVDLRMFFTNSDAELFEVTISYTFDRFVATLHSGALLALCCEVIWYLCQSTEPINTLF